MSHISSMTDAEYMELLEQTIKEMGEIGKQRIELAVEMDKRGQFARAVANLLSDEAKANFEKKWGPWLEQAQRNQASLVDAVRRAIQSGYPQWLTVVNVRDKIVREQAFNFSSYASNPLSSVSTTLRRIKEAGDAEAIELDGVIAYRWKGQPPSHEGPFMPRPSTLQNAVERSYTERKLE
jgi:hypothetical protein